jgi:uncharacterized damage-inducible protein DinB
MIIRSIYERSWRILNGFESMDRTQQKWISERNFVLTRKIIKLMDTTQLIDTWQIHSRINLYLLDAIPEAHLADISASKGRTVGEQFAHMHNVRLMWIKEAQPALMEDLTKLEKDNISKTSLAGALLRSAEAVSLLLKQGFAQGKIKGFKPHPAAFLGYLISHEGHHRGQILLSLKQSGHPVDKQVQYGIWEWGVR